MKGFSESEVKLLIEKAKYAKQNSAPLVSVFESFAKESGRAFGSVRNYYYKMVKTASKKESLYQKLGLSENLKPAFIVEFTKAEERALLYSVFKGIYNGKSVRKVILELSGGREKLALRYQNKYRNLIKNNSPMIDEVFLLIERDFGKIAVSKIKRKLKSTDYERLEKQINVMLDNIVKKISLENEIIKKRAELLERENRELKTKLIRPIG